MQRSKRTKEKDSKALPAARVCPRCGNPKIRRSYRKLSDGLFILSFCKVYRCQACRYRFWEISPVRMVVFLGSLLVIVPLLTIGWYTLEQAQKPVEKVAQDANDPVLLLAEQGDAEAELKMGLRHTTFAWGDKDDRKAVQWFEKAAQHGQVEAQFRYGAALLEGQGVVQEYKEAFFWLEKAAQGGNAEAQYAIGEMYREGIGTDSNAEQAYLWFNLAASQGIDKAVAARELVIKLLTPAQVTAIQIEARRISQEQRLAKPKAETKQPVAEAAKKAPPQQLPKAKP